MNFPIEDKAGFGRQISIQAIEEVMINMMPRRYKECKKGVLNLNSEKAECMCVCVRRRTNE